MKKIAGKLLIIEILLISFFVFNISAQSEPDYPESLGNCLGVYKINSKIRPKGLLDFEYFYLEKFPNQNTDNPKKDLENRVFIRGEVKLTDNTILKIKKAFVRSININDDEDYYKDIYFETVKVNGLSYKFEGKFLEKMILEDGQYSEVKGILTKFENDKKIAESQLSFYEYAEL